MPAIRRSPPTATATRSPRTGIAHGPTTARCTTRAARSSRRAPTRRTSSRAWAGGSPAAGWAAPGTRRYAPSYGRERARAHARGVADALAGADEPALRDLAPWASPAPLLEP